MSEAGDSTSANAPGVAPPTDHEGDHAYPDAAPVPKKGRVWPLALVPGLVVGVASVVVAVCAGDPEAFPTIGSYRVTLNIAVLMRMFGMFIAVALVWWELRTRDADRTVLIAAVVSGPVTYAVIESVRMLSFFPAPEAAYYVVNPLTVAALGSQTATAVLVEVIWRGTQRRRGRWPGRVITWPLFAMAVSGLVVVYFSVLHAGGTTGFFLFSNGYRWLFT